MFAATIVVTAATAIAMVGGYLAIGVPERTPSEDAAVAAATPTIAPPSPAVSMPPAEDLADQFEAWRKRVGAR